MCQSPDPCAATRNTPTTPPSSAVFIVNNDLPERRRLEQTIAAAGWLPQTVSSIGELETQHRLLAPACLVLDGLVPERYLLRVGTPLIFLAAQDDISMTVRAMKAGAFDVLEKPVRVDVLLDVIRRALDLSATSMHKELERRQIQERYQSLSRREREVMTLVLSGLLNKQVGGKLGISEITVKAHRGKMMRKMRARTFVSLIHMASALQVDSPGEIH